MLYTQFGNSPPWERDVLSPSRVAQGRQALIPAQIHWTAWTAFLGQAGRIAGSNRHGQDEKITECVFHLVYHNPNTRLQRVDPLGRGRFFDFQRLAVAEHQ